MKRIIKKLMKEIAFVGMSIVMVMLSAIPVFAIEYSYENSLTSLTQIGSDGNPTFVAPDKVIGDTYWIDLEEVTVTNINQQKYYGVFPKYVLKPDESAMKSLGVATSGNGSSGYFPNTGITDTIAGMMIIDPQAFYRLGYLVGEDTYAPPDNGKVSTDPIPDRVNPFKFKESDLLTQDEIKDPTKLTVFADIKKSGSSNSTEIGEYTPGESMNLDFSIDASWFKRFLIGYTLDMTRTGYTLNEDIQKIFNETKGMFDSQIVYTLDIPEDLDAQKASATLTGLEGFDINTEIKNSSNSKTLVVSIRLKQDKQAKPELWKDTIEKIKKIDTSNIKVSISGLSVKSTANTKDNITLRGTASGYYEWALSRTDDFSAKNKDARHIHLYFAAKQGNEGRDVGSPANKPNLISYTFKVNKPVTSTVTFINGSDRYASVKVENGKSIDEDSLTDQSMPTNPTKSGYTFKGWATKKDAKTPDFTGKTVVNNDLTVYAIWEKNSTPVNPGGGSTTDPIVPNKPERIDGNDRIETAVKVSQKSYPNGTKAVILANKDKFSDVLTAVPFSVQIGAPILFTNTDSIPVETKNEIKRLGATQVYINGGTSSVTQSIEDTLKKEGKSVTRFNGVDRYDTAKLIGERVRANGSKDVVEIASGETFPDALSISSLAVKENAPILLSKKNDLTPVTKKAISDWKIEKATIAGQTNTISAMVEKDVTNVIKKTSRLGGADRYETSAIIAKAAVPDSRLGVYTSGEVFADALVAGPYVGINKAPVLLVNKDRVPTSIAKYTKESKINRAVVIGGTSTVYDSTFNQIKDLIAKK